MSGLPWPLALEEIGAQIDAGTNSEGGRPTCAQANSATRRRRGLTRMPCVCLFSFCVAVNSKIQQRAAISTLGESSGRRSSAAHAAPLLAAASDAAADRLVHIHWALTFSRPCLSPSLRCSARLRRRLPRSSVGGWIRAGRAGHTRPVVRRHRHQDRPSTALRSGQRGKNETWEQHSATHRPSQRQSALPNLPSFLSLRVSCLPRRSITTGGRKSTTNGSTSTHTVCSPS